MPKPSGEKPSGDKLTGREALPDLFGDWTEQSAPRQSPFKRTAEETISFIMKLRNHGFRDTALARAFELVPRESFAPRKFADLAMKDYALPLPCGQTMTAPLTVAKMLAALEVDAHHQVLEIGAGSGYVTALLGKLAAQVMSVERFKSLSVEAAAKLSGASISNVRLIHADGLSSRLPAMLGMDGAAGFDRILVNGALPAWPDMLVQLLKPRGLAVAVIADGAGARLETLVRNGGGHDRTVQGVLSMPSLRTGVAEAL